MKTLVLGVCRAPPLHWKLARYLTLLVWMTRQELNSAVEGDADL